MCPWNKNRPMPSLDCFPFEARAGTTKRRTPGLLMRAWEVPLRGRGFELKRQRAAQTNPMRKTIF